MAPGAKKKRVSSSQGQEIRGRLSSGSSSFHSQVIDDEENEGSRGERIKRRLSFDSNASGYSSCLLSRSWRSGSFASKAKHFDADIQSSATSNRRVVVENLAQVWVEQQVTACGGVGKGWLEAVAEKLSSTEEPLDILELDGMELLDHDQDLALALLCDPDAFATELMDHILLLLSSGQLWKSCLRASAPDVPPARGSRLWIRFTSIPLPLISVRALLQRSSELICTNNGTNKQLVYVYGVVYAISNITRRIFRQRYICKVCKSKYDVYVHQGCDFSLPHGCCQTWIREDIESHDYVPHQEILLGPVPSVATLHDTSSAAKPFGQEVVAVSLFDDLTGRLELGDSVAIIGHAAMHATSIAVNNLNLGSLPPSGYRFAEVRIMANNTFAPFKLNLLKVSINPKLQQASQAFRTEGGQVSLDKLCNAISSHGPGVQLWPKLLPIALLLSLVVSDSSDYDHQKKPISSVYPLLESSSAEILKGGLCSRKQIHILIATKSFSSVIMLQTLQAAALYAARSMYETRGDAILVAKNKQEDASQDRQMWYAGCLALSKGGVLVLDLPLLTKSKIRSLCEAMDKRPLKMQQSRSDQISSSPTIWGISHELSYRCGTQSNQSKGSSIHPALLSAFDIVLQEPPDMLSDSQGLQNLIIDLNKSSNTSTFAADLQQHLLAASSIPSVGITEEAHNLLCSYYLALRRRKEYNDCMLEKPDDASLLTLQSLLRVAEACAKLCWSSEIREIPDATLTILLCESSYLAKFGRSFVRDRMTTKSDERGDSYDSTIFSIPRNGDFDHELRDFHSKLVSCLYHSNPCD